MVEHLDEWDSAAGTLPAVGELVSQKLPDIARLGALVLRGRAVEAAPCTVLRKYAEDIEVRQYLPHVRVTSTPGEVPGVCG